MYSPHAVKCNNNQIADHPKNSSLKLKIAKLKQVTIHSKRNIDKNGKWKIRH